MKQLQPGTKIVVASHNPGKVWEINQLIAPYGLDAVSAGELGLPEPDETEATFEGNAKLKALAAAQASGLPALADDSGLEVQCLRGAPGIYSARWAGPGKDFGIAMQKVAGEITARTAWKGFGSAAAGPRANFISVLCLAWPDGETRVFTGQVFGHLEWPPRGGNGFGYDPMFVADGETLTFGEMEPKQKYAISHRTRAFEAFKRDCLEHMSQKLPFAPDGRLPAGESPSAMQSGRDIAALSAAAANLSTKEELFRFLSNLSDDLARNKEAWSTADLAPFLTRVQGHLKDTDSKDEEPRWRTTAKALLGASIAVPAAGADLDPAQGSAMQRYFLDDLHAGQTFMSAQRTLTAQDLSTFARNFDPQPFHLDAAAAKSSLFGSIAASGWHTAALTMRLNVDGGLPLAGGLIGAEVELSWPRPTRPGDVLQVENEILEVTPSRSRPDRGMAKVRSTTRNASGETVQVMTGKMIVPRRPAEQG